MAHGSQLHPAFASSQPCAHEQPNTCLTTDFHAKAVSHAGIGVVLLDSHGIMRHWNAAAGRLLGFPAEEFLGKPMESLCPHEFQPLVSRAVHRCLQQHSVNHVDVALVPPGGLRLVHLGLTISCVKNDADECIGAAIWIRDISSSKEIESHLSRAAHMASLGTLAAGLAHHFNNIVCSMSTMVDLAITTEDPAVVHRALQMSAEAANRISFITQTLSAFSTPGNPDEDLSDLTEVVLHFADTVEPTLARRDIHLQLDLHSKRMAAVPRHLFTQVLQHLLTNAQDAIALRAAPHATISIRSRSQGDQVMLQFCDTGVGILPEHLPHVFDPFFTTKGVVSGGSGSHPGLGLTLVHGVVMDLGGHVWADNGSGRGATINMLLPAT
jgi:PAS domain S-box-containing protein